MAGLFVLLSLFLFAALMFFLYRYDRKNNPTKFPLKDHLIGFDSMKGSWSSSSTTKGTGENPLKVVGESHDQDVRKKIFRPRTDEGVEKTDNATIVVRESHDQDVQKKTYRPSTDEGEEKTKNIGTIIVEEDDPEG